MAKSVLITGANKGIGFEVARAMARKGYHVYLGARDDQRGAAAAAVLTRDGGRVEHILMDVTQRDTILNARSFIARTSGKLDVLINNAAILLDFDILPSVSTEDILRKTFDTNFFGHVYVIQQFIELLRAANDARIVNVSSGLASLSRTGDPDHPYSKLKSFAYCTSKAALNMATVQFANELRDTAIKINAADPDYCATDINNRRGSRTPAQGAEVIVKLATLPCDGPTGAFFNDDGSIPW